eukprot:CAMPEP_0206291970 /NCGR_PEP_ID=MMETSP0106_2-20121207/3387_1 /ASSEMBLY_ACC=CAM_ASM_000206 /TAXON_ID=81532 /ORGANISM="Acanthoeca-like sp., Strain 10tr" /LENGTH=128 /DNA_ID=CAMNT_0053722533 /DNA_START=40 /DNA_END=427 /DNA_ORIENTATION=+
MPTPAAAQPNISHAIENPLAGSTALAGRPLLQEALLGLLHLLELFRAFIRRQLAAVGVVEPASPAGCVLDLARRGAVWQLQVAVRSLHHALLEDAERVVEFILDTVGAMIPPRGLDASERHLGLRPDR